MRKLHNPQPYWKRKRKLTGTGWKRSIYDEIWERDDGICIYCGEVGQQVDHVVPRSAGGPSIRANGVVACRRCNLAKLNQFDSSAESLLFITRAITHLRGRGECLTWMDSWGTAQVRELPTDIQGEEATPEVLQQQLSLEELAEATRVITERAKELKALTDNICAVSKEDVSRRTNRPYIR